MSLFTKWYLLAFPDQKRTEASAEDFRTSFYEEAVRYDKSPFEGNYAYNHFLWNTWKVRGCRLPEEQDVKGYDY